MRQPLSILCLSQALATASFVPTRLYVATEPSIASQLGLQNNPISPFGKGTKATNQDKQLLGGKGANLAEMTSLGLAVPPGGGPS